jgi:hypothetical protein
MRHLGVHEKWSDHGSIRGLNMGTDARLRGSSTSVLAAFRNEHETQAKAKFSGIVNPPADRGLT